MPCNDSPYKVLIVDQCIAMWWNQSCMRFATKNLRKFIMKSPPTHCHCLTLTQTPPIAKMLHDNKRCHFWTVTEAAASHVTVTYIGIVTWCWPLSVRLMLTPVRRSPMLCLTCEVPYDAPRLTLSWSWFTQTPLPLWMTVPDNGPISFLTPLPSSAFSSVSCRPITFSPLLQNCFNFGAECWVTPTLVADLWFKPLPANIHKPDNHQCHHYFGPNNLGTTVWSSSLPIFKILIRAC